MIEKKKLPKGEVDYSKGMGTTRCKNCQHFLAPSECKRVDGVIGPEYWCKLFKWRRAKVLRT